MLARRPLIPTFSPLDCKCAHQVPVGYLLRVLSCREYQTNAPCNPWVRQLSALGFPHLILRYTEVAPTLSLPEQINVPAPRRAAWARDRASSRRFPPGLRSGCSGGMRCRPALVLCSSGSERGLLSSDPQGARGLQAEHTECTTL